MAGEERNLDVGRYLSRAAGSDTGTRAIEWCNVAKSIKETFSARHLGFRRRSLPSHRFAAYRLSTWRVVLRSSFLPKTVDCAVKYFLRLKNLSTAMHSVYARVTVKITCEKFARRKNPFPRGLRFQLSVLASTFWKLFGNSIRIVFRVFSLRIVWVIYFFDCYDGGFYRYLFYGV